MKRILRNDIHWAYINLSHRTDRRMHIEAELARVGIKADRFEALRRSDYHGPDRDIKLMLKTPNTIGNFLSHLAVWQYGWPAAPIIGVLEDDALFCDDFQDRLAYIEKHFDRAWDIFYLGGTFHVNPAVWHREEIGRDCELTDVKHIVRTYGAFSNQGYLVNSRSVPKLVSLMQENMYRARGHDHCTIQLQPALRCFAFVPGCIFQIDGYSDIGEANATFSGFMKLGAHVFAKRMTDFNFDTYNWAEARI